MIDDNAEELSKMKLNNIFEISSQIGWSLKIFIEILRQRNIYKEPTDFLNDDEFEKLKELFTERLNSKAQTKSGKPSKIKLNVKGNLVRAKKKKLKDSINTYDRISGSKKVRVYKKWYSKMISTF